MGATRGLSGAASAAPAAAAAAARLRRPCGPRQPRPRRRCASAAGPWRSGRQRCREIPRCGPCARHARPWPLPCCPAWGSFDACEVPSVRASGCQPAHPAVSQRIRQAAGAGCASAPTPERAGGSRCTARPWPLPCCPACQPALRIAGAVVGCRPEALSTPGPTIALVGPANELSVHVPS